MGKFKFYVAETRHFEIEVEAEDSEAAYWAGYDIWVKAPEVGGYELPCTTTDFSVLPNPSTVREA